MSTTGRASSSRWHVCLFLLHVLIWGGHSSKRLLAKRDPFLLVWVAWIDRHLTEIARYDKVDEILLHSIRSGNHQLYEWGPSFDLRRHSHPPASLSVSSRLSAHRDISRLDDRDNNDILDVFWSLLTLTTSHTQINVFMLITINQWICFVLVVFW